MDVSIVDNVKESRYEVFVDGQAVGVEVYEIGDGSISLVHTEIDRSFGGQGLAAQLVTYALDDARSRGLTVLPHCPYVAKFIREHAPEYLDLVPEAERSRFDLSPLDED